MTWTQDMRFATRALRRSPAFAAVSVATLALAIGANTAVFSMVDTFVLRALPIPDADRTYEIYETAPVTGDYARASWAENSWSGVSGAPYFSPSSGSGRVA